MKKFIVKEREFLQMSKPMAWSGKRVARWTPWRKIGTFPSLDGALMLRGARNWGLFQRAVFYDGRICVDANGRHC